MIDANQVACQRATLEVESLDRIYLHGYVPRLQLPGQFVRFLASQRRGVPVHPGRQRHMSDAFVAAVRAFAEANRVPLMRFEEGASQDEIVAERYKGFAPAQGVVLIGVAVEKTPVFAAQPGSEDERGHFEYSRQLARVDQYYFYVQDEEFGPAFVKVCAEAPFAIKVCLNGHEWARQQLRRAGVAFEAADDCFLSCAEPRLLQRHCDELGIAQIQAFFHHWLTRLPMPLPGSRPLGPYPYRLSVWDVAVSNTQVFSQPVRDGTLLAEVLRASPPLGRERLHRVFERCVRDYTPRLLGTQITQTGATPGMRAWYGSCQVQQYVKDECVLRTETIVDDPRELGMGRDIAHLPKLWQLGREMNRVLLEAQRASEDSLG